MYLRNGATLDIVVVADVVVLSRIDSRLSPSLALYISYAKRTSAVKKFKFRTYDIGTILRDTTDASITTDNRQSGQHSSTPLSCSHVECFSVAEVGVPRRIDGSNVEDVLPGSGPAPPPVQERNVYGVHTVRPRYNLKRKKEKNTKERHRKTKEKTKKEYRMGQKFVSNDDEEEEIANNAGRRNQKHDMGKGRNNDRRNEGMMAEGEKERRKEGKEENKGDRTKKRKKNRKRKNEKKETK